MSIVAEHHLTRQLKGLQSRFLFPFFFDSENVREATTAMCDATIVGERAWEATRSPDLYRDELLEHVSSYLFPEPGRAETAAYLRLSEHLANRIFHGLVGSLRGNEKVGVSLVHRTGVEVFLTSQGVGLLSVTLEMAVSGATLERALEFNYLGAIRHPATMMVLRIPHSSDNVEQWASLKDEIKAKVPPRPAEDAALEQRLGVAGGHFTLSELAAALLAPLHTLHYRPVHGSGRVPNVPAVYTAARLDVSVRFDDPVIRRTLAPFLSGLSQVEEPRHAGTVPDEMGVPAAALNLKHWAAVSQLGTAHLVADQPAGIDGKEPEFNTARLPQVMDKYFVPFLLTYLERLTLQRTLREAAAEVTSFRRDASSPTVARLREAVLAFAVGGRFTQISTRHALHRYHQLVRTGLDIDALWTEVRHALADLDARQQAEAQRLLSEGMANSLIAQQNLSHGMAQSLTAGVRMQHSVHVIEVFLVAVYSAHFVLMIIETLHPIAKTSHGLERFLDLGSPMLVGGAAILGFLIARRLVKQGDKEDEVTTYKTSKLRRNSEGRVR